MKATLVGAFLAAALIALPLFALAKQGDAIPGIAIGLEGDPGSAVISQTKANSTGVAVFRNVKPGKYRLTIGTISENESRRPTAVIEINIPGQTKVGRIVSEADGHSMNLMIKAMKTADRPLVPFTVAGNEVRTVTVTITRGPGSK
jgi:hypothetical protein